MAGMVDAYTIGINLEVTGNATTSLGKFSELVEATTLNVKELTDQLKFMNRTFMRTDELVMGAARAMRIFGTRSAESLRLARTELKEFNTQLGINSTLASRAAIKGGVGGFGAGGLATRLGAAPLVAGAAVFGFADIFKSQERFAGAQAQFAAQGFGPGATNRAVGAALGSNIPGVSTTSFLKAATDALVVTKDPAQAALLAPLMARQEITNKILSAQMGGNLGGHAELMLASAAEIKTGSKNAAVLARTLEMFQKLLLSDSFRITPRDFKMFEARGGAGAKGQTFAGMAAWLPEIQQIGGGVAGMGFSAAMSALHGTMSLKKIAAYERIGLISPSDVVRRGRGHAFVKPDSFKGHQLAAHNFPLWVTTVLSPLLASHGFPTLGGQQMATFSMFPLRAARMVADLLAQHDKIQASMGAATHAFGIGPAFGLAQKTPTGEVRKLTAAWDTFTTSLGKLAMPEMIKGLHVLTDIIKLISITFGNVGAFWSHSGASHLETLGHQRFNKTKHYFGSFFSYPTSHHEHGTPVILKMDSTKVAESIIPRISDAMNRPPSHSTLVNSHVNLWPTAMNYLGAGL